MSRLGKVARSPFVTLPAGCALLLWCSTSFRLDATFSFVEPGSLRIFLPFVAFAMGAAFRYLIAERPSAAGRRRLLRRQGAAVLATFVGLWILHAGFVHFEDGWPRAWVTGATREPADAGSPALAACACPEDVSDEFCIEILMGLGAVQEGIYECWGKAEVRAVEYALAVLYLLFAAGFGNLAALLPLPGPPVRVFVSYRRRDSVDLVTGPLAAALRGELGADNVFIDRYAIKAGAKWKRQIRKYADVCDAFVVMIGPAWLDELRAKERSPETDWVRYEIELALHRNVRLIPFLFGGAAMPAARDLPPGLRPMLEVQAVVLDPDAVAVEDGFEVRDQGELDKALEELLLVIEKVRLLSAA